MNQYNYKEVKPALCLDLDGTVRVIKSGKPFAESVDDYKLNGDIEVIINKYKDNGFLIIAISNQGGIAWGFKTEQGLQKELAHLSSLFNKDPFDMYINCRFDPTGNIEPYCHRSLCRKPSYGMLALAENQAYLEGYVIDWDASLFIGDRPEDEECAKSANVEFIHIDKFLKTY